LSNGSKWAELARKVDDHAARKERHGKRVAISIQIELRENGSDVPIRAETSDIGVGGCYVEMGLTLPVGTALNLVLWLGSEKLATKGKVVTCHPQFGNGIEFIDIAPDSHIKLQKFLDEAFQAGPETASTGQ